MKVLLVLITILLASPISAQTTDLESTEVKPYWIYATRTNDNEKWYIRSVIDSKDDNGDLKVWVKTTYPTAIWSKKTYKNSYSVTLYAVSCTNTTMGITKFIVYRSDGIVIYSKDMEEYEIKMKEVAPDSVGETLVNKVCELHN